MCQHAAQDDRTIRVGRRVGGIRRCRRVLVVGERARAGVHRPVVGEAAAQRRDHGATRDQTLDDHRVLLGRRVEVRERSVEAIDQATDGELASHSRQIGCVTRLRGVRHTPGNRGHAGRVRRQRRDESNGQPCKTK